MNFSTASPPYSAWSHQATLEAGSSPALSSFPTTPGHILDVGVITGVGVQWHFYLNNAISQSASVVSDSAYTTATQSAQHYRDIHTRYWAVVSDHTGGSVEVYEATTPGTSNWTVSFSASGVTATTSPVAAICGNFLVVAYQTAPTTFTYVRIDVSVSTLGSWSTPKTFSLAASTASSTFCLRGNPSGKGMFVYNGTAGIAALSYDPVSDTWGTETALTSNGSDTQPTLATVGSNFYAVWCSYVSVNNYSIDFNVWRGGTQTWDIDKINLVPAGANNHFPQVAYGSNIIGVAYTVGTAAPYSINFEIALADGGLIPLSLYGINTSSVTLSTASTLATQTGGTATATPITSAPSSGTSLYMEALSQGGTGSTSASLPAQSGKGWLYESTVLENRKIPAGNWSAFVTVENGSRINGQTLSSMTIRFSVRSSSGVYTTIGTIALTNPFVPHSLQVFSFPATAMPGVSFGAGDKLYIDYFYQSGTGANAWASDAMAITMTFDYALGMSNNLQVATPGYEADPPLTVYGSAAASTTLITADKLATTLGGTETSSRTTAPASGTSLWMEALSQGGTGTTNASIPAQSGNGWLLDSALLENQSMNSGNWSASVAVRDFTRSLTLGNMTIRFSKRSSGGVYTTIGSLTLASPAVTTSRSVFAFSATALSGVSFVTGDKLYLDFFYQSSGTAGWASDAMDIFITTASTAGLASDLQAATPGYTATPNYYATVLRDNPIRLYKLNETSGTSVTDYGSQAQNGTLHGTVTLNQASMIPSNAADGSMLFDGTTGYMQAATTGLPTGAQVWSMEGWITMPTVPATGIHIMAEWGTNTSNEAAAIGIFTGVIRLNTYSANNILGPTAVNGTTYYIVGTYDGTNLRLYVNGALQGSPLAATPAIALTYCYIGTEDNAADDFFSGKIQGVAFYNTVLSATQVSTHYNAGITIFSPQGAIASPELKAGVITGGINS